MMMMMMVVIVVVKMVTMTMAMMMMMMMHDKWAVDRWKEEETAKAKREKISESRYTFCDKSGET